MVKKELENNNKEILNYIKIKTGIEIPIQIIEFYSKNKKQLKDTFIYSEYKSIKDGNEPWITVLIAEKLAKEIIRLIDISIEENGIEFVFNLIKNNEFNGIKNIGIKNERLINLKTNTFLEEDLEELVFNEILFTVNDYDFKKERFNFSLVQEAFQNMNSDINLLKCILILNVDCGGGAGIIVKGEKTAYSISYYHGAYDTVIIHRGKNIEYQGFLDDKWEKPYFLN